MNSCIIEANLTTSIFSYPFHRGWLDAPEWLVLPERVSAELLRDDSSIALIDAIEATRLFETHSVISDIALVSTHQSVIRMHSAQRPDEVEHAVVQLGEVSPTAEALARSTIHHFYGIDVVDWNRSQQPGDVTILDGPEALRVNNEGYMEDLVRAWFILTSLPVPTHVLVAPRETVEQSPDSIETVVDLLRRAVSMSEERRRELRRNVSADYELDRDRLTDFLNDQKPWLTKSGRKGWIDLANRVQRAMNLPDNLNPDVVSTGKHDGD